MARARAYEGRNDPARAAADYRHAASLAPRGVFDTIAQAQAREKVKQLSKKVPCGGGAESTCL